MAELIGIVGDPGSGKSTSLKGLPPDKTVYEAVQPGQEQLFQDQRT